MNIKDQKILIFDGACGTNLQSYDIAPEVWGEYDGCTEWLNISAPEIIRELHTKFLNAGANVLEANSFGGSEIVAGEYNLIDRLEELNFLAVKNAKDAITQSGKTAWVAGSMGPTTKLPSLGHIDADEMSRSFFRHSKNLIEAGADILIIETCQDILQTKLAVIAAHEAFEKTGIELPLMCSLTIEQAGTMLVGTDIATAAAVLEPFNIFSLGLNCATGPEMMKSHLRYLSQNWPYRISCIPNAGMPTVVNGCTCYQLSPEDYASSLRDLIVNEGVSIVGGCCGTTPAHIEKLTEYIADVEPKPRNVKFKPQVASAYQPVTLKQEPAPFMIGERANANGSKKFRELLLADDYDGALKVGIDQQNAGVAHAVDLCVAYAGRDEKADMKKLGSMFAESVRLPLVIDSTSSEVIEQALKIYPGRPIINSVNLENGPDTLIKVCNLAKKYGAALVCLTIDEVGMAMTAERKLEIAKRIHDIATKQCGLRSSDLIFDTLAFTIGSGDDKYRDAGIETLNGIRLVKENMTDVFTTLGLSNISFGLTPASRKILNSCYLSQAIKAGLDTTIVAANRILPLSKVSEEDRKVAMDLIFNRSGDENPDPLASFIEHFSNFKIEDSADKEKQEAAAPEQQLTNKIMSGEREGLEDLLQILLQRYKPTEIINDILIPSMRVIGELFGKGEMLLPFVLQSAEAMRKSVDLLEPHMDKVDNDSSTKVLLATVIGDVHDIGKNLVDIILSNNGYKVYNIGIKVPAETIIEKAREYNVDAIGLSGLLVKSAIAMKESMKQYSDAGLTQPILLGGAALTKKFVAQECAPEYTTGNVVYCSDAFASLTALQEHEAGRLESSTWTLADQQDKKPAGNENVSVPHDNKVPEVPFTGVKYCTEAPVEKLFDYINTQALFRGRWGYRRGKNSPEQYAELVETTVKPLYDQLKQRVLNENLIEPKIAYGYFDCYSQGNSLLVDNNGKEIDFAFPRQATAPYLCISDFYHTKPEGGDKTGFFVVSIGDKLGKIGRDLFEAKEYHDYMILHGLGTEITDALAEYWHQVMRKEMKIQTDSEFSIENLVAQNYQGSRYGFGYPACPDLEMQKLVFDLLKPEKLGITLTENMGMVPELTTSAIIAHHSQAKYFSA